MKAGQLVNKVFTRSISKIFTNLSTGIYTAFVDQVELVPQGKVMLVDLAAVRVSAANGAMNVALFLCKESLRNVQPVDPNLTISSTGPDIQTGMVPIGFSAAQIATLPQGSAWNAPKTIIIPYGFFMKAIVVSGTGTATGIIVYLDYSYVIVDQKCDILF